MDKKTISIISYITIIGWLIAYFSNSEKSSLAKYHLKQSFGLAILGFVNGIAASIVGSITPVIGFVFPIISICIFVLMILGIINASNEKEKPLPVIGSLFVDKFDFIQ